MLIKETSKTQKYKPKNFSQIMRFKNKESITDIDVRNEKILLRVDFNVPIDEQGNITDDRRIRYTLPTLYFLLNENCRIIIVSHLGRPKGKVQDKYRLDPIVKRLKELLPFYKIYKSNDCIGEEVEELANNLKPRQILVLENPRFHKEEKTCDAEFSKKLASLADIYINDAFATAHRKHATTYGVCKYIKESGYGFLMEKEMKFLSHYLSRPKRPFSVILGGAKVADKLEVIDYLIGLVDNILIGGGMAYTFLEAQGYAIGKSMCDVSKVQQVKEFIKTAKENGTRIYLPKDVVVCNSFQDIDTIEVVPITDIPENKMGVDIGCKTITEYQNILKDSKQVIWNGPMGIFEIKEFETGTREIAKNLIEYKIFTIIGGGDSAAAFEKFGFDEDVSFISTGGGASLEVMKGKSLPSIECLTDKTPDIIYE